MSDTLTTTRARALMRDVAVHGLLGACRVIVKDSGGLGPVFQHEQLKAAVARCEAKLAAIDAEGAV